MPARPRADLVMLYQRALICRTFPAYRLEDLKHVPAAQLIRAMKLLEIAAQVNQRG